LIGTIFGVIECPHFTTERSLFETECMQFFNENMKKCACHCCVAIFLHVEPPANLVYVPTPPFLARYLSRKSPGNGSHSVKLPEVIVPSKVTLVRLVQPSKDPIQITPFGIVTLVTFLFPENAKTLTTGLFCILGGILTSLFVPIYFLIIKSMGAVQTAGHPQDATPPTFESVWALFQKVGESQKENAQAIKELRESQKTTDRQIQRTDSELGKLSKRMGEVVEYLVAPDLRKKFNEFGFNFSESSQRKDVIDEDNNISFEIDVFLENYRKAMLVEVKTTPTTEDVKDHVKRLEKMRKYADLHGNSGLKSERTFFGAVAGEVIKDTVRKYILKQGFFVIEPSGEGFNITPPNGKPKEW